jgi:hypothetical protein
MEELLRTNDLVLISAVEAILGGLGIKVFVADGYAASVDGSLGVLPRRVLAPSERADEARAALAEAGLAGELSEPRA